MLFVAPEGVAEAGEPAFVNVDLVAALAGVFGQQLPLAGGEVGRRDDADGDVL